MRRYFRETLMELDRRSKQALMIATDFILLPIALCLAFFLRSDFQYSWLYFIDNIFLFLAVPILTVPFFIHNGLYRAVLKYMGSQVIIASLKSITYACVLIGFYVLFTNNTVVSVEVIIIYWFVSNLMTIGTRYIVKALLYSSDLLKKRVAIYGAGRAGAQLIDNLKASSEYIPVAIFDDSKNKWGTVVNSILIYTECDLYSLH